MSFQPDNRNERDVLPPRITTSNVTLDKEKSSIRSPQPTDGVAMYDVQNFKKSSQSRPIAPASLSSLNTPSPFLPRTFNSMYSQMPSVMMATHGAVPYFPFPRHISALAVSAPPAGVATPASVHGPPRPSLTAPGRPPVVAHHVKPSQPSQLHTMPGIPRPVHPASTTLQQTRSPSPKLVQESAASELPKGDIKSQATPTEAHSVVESRPAMSEPASHSLHHKTSTATTSKTVLSPGVSKNMLGLSTQPVIGAPTYIQHTTSTSPHLTSVSRTSIPGLSTVGPVSSVTSNFNIPKVLSHGAITPGLGSLYSQPSPVSFAARSPQLQDHPRLLKPSSTTSSVSFGGHTGTLPATVVSAQTVGANARIDGNRQLPASFSGISQFFDSHTGTVSSLPPHFKPYAPIESVVRKPTSIAQVPSVSHVTTGISSVQLMTAHNPAAPVAVVNMGVPFTNSESINENPVIHNNSSHSNSTSIFSVQSMLSTTSSSIPNIPSSTNVTSLSPRPSILRKRQEITRKPINQPSLGDPVVLVRTNDISGSPRPDGTLSTSHSRQNSPKSESGTQNLEQPQKTIENGPSHPSILSPSKIKREFSSPSSTPSIPAVNTVSLAAIPPHDVGASPRKKPRKQNVIATEDKFSSLPMQVQEINEKKSMFIDKLDQEEDEELKFLMLKRRCVSIYGGYKVNNKAAHNHFQRYSDVKAKDEKKPSLQEIASERSVTQRATGWKIHHVAAQLDELKTCEEEVLLKMYEFRERLPKYKPDHKRYDEMVMLHELLQGNIQRSQLVIEQLGETKKTTVKILDHQKGIMDILKKNIKRHVKKKS